MKLSLNLKMPMVSSTVSANDASIWESLKQAIATSSGFKRWQQERCSDDQRQHNLDFQIRQYLQETLKTLAY